MELGEFQFQEVRLKKNKCEREYTTGKFSCLEGKCISTVDDQQLHVLYALKGEIVLTRALGYFILHVILPTFFLISCTVGSFWIKLQAAPARIFLAICAIYSCISSQASVNRGVPKVSYIKVS